MGNSGIPFHTCAGCHHAGCRDAPCDQPGLRRRRQLRRGLHKRLCRTFQSYNLARICRYAGFAPYVGSAVILISSLVGGHSVQAATILNCRAVLECGATAPLYAWIKTASCRRTPIRAGPGGNPCRLRLAVAAKNEERNITAFIATEHPQLSRSPVRGHLPSARELPS